MKTQATAIVKYGRHLHFQMITLSFGHLSVQELSRSDEIIEAITTIWKNITFQELQNVFSE
jgi:hypothetical protein